MLPRTVDESEMEPWDEHLPEALIENGAQGISRSYHRGAAAPLGELARRT